MYLDPLCPETPAHVVILKWLQSQNKLGLSHKYLVDHSSGNLHPSDGHTSLHGFTIVEPKVPLGGAGAIPMSVCCGLSPGTCPAPVPWFHI